MDRDQGHLSRTHNSKAEVIRLCKANPGILIALDAGDGWTSLWLSKRRGEAPRSHGMINPQGQYLASM